MAWDDIIGVLKPTPQQWQDFLNRVKNLALEDLAVSDTTTNNASTSKHGLMPKGDGIATHFYRSDGAQTVPAGAAGIGGGTGATDGAILLADGVSSDTIKTSSKTIETTLTDSDTKIPTSGAVTDALAGKMPNPWYDYLELYAADADLPATDPLGANPTEGMVDLKTTTVNGNRYAYGRFTDGGTEDLQWLKHFKPDWNGDDATLGKVSFMVIWAADSGVGTFKFDLAGKLLGNDDATDTALTSIGSVTDTLITAGDWHYSPWSTPALISALTTGGKSAFFKGTRDSATDTLNATARVSAVIVKYIRTGAY